MILDEQQRAIVALPPDASAVVLGAPGTGKTAVIVERVRALLGEDTAAAITAEEVLVLTPSRSSATVLRDVIGVRLHTATPGPLARSIGSLAYQIVHATRAADGRPAPVLLTGAEQDRTVADLLDGDIADERRDRWPFADLSVLGSPEFRSELRAFIDEAIELHLTPGDLAAFGNPLWAAVASFMRDYQDILTHARPDHVSAPELLVAATAAVRSGRSLGSLDALRVVLIDDAQELSPGAIELVRALHESGRAVLAFGDPDISAGAFRGATPASFNELVAVLGGPLVLTTQHRQRHAGLVRTLREVTGAIGAAGRAEHRAAPPDTTYDASVRSIVVDTPSAEYEAIAEQLRLWHLRDDVPWEQLAVIAHDAGDVALLERELAAREVPARAVGVQRPLGQVKEVHDLLRIVQTALTPVDERSADDVRELLEGTYGGLTPVALRRLRAALRQHEWQSGGDRSADELMLEAFNVPSVLTAFDSDEARAAARLARITQLVAADAAAGQTVHELFWSIWSSARIADGRHLSKVLTRAAEQPGSPASRALDALVQLFDLAKRSGEREITVPPLEFVAEVLRSEVPLDALVGRGGAAQVAVLTPAAAGGLEFDRVIIARVQDGVWPNLRLRGSTLGGAELREALEASRTGQTTAPTTVLDRQRAVFHDELRLLARALSRARDEVVLTAVADDDIAPSTLLEFVPEPPEQAAERVAAASEWDAGFPLTLRGAVAMYRRRLTESDDEAVWQHAAEQLKLLAAAGVPGADPAQWFGTRGPSTDRPLFNLERGPVPISPSRLGTFEQCELDWVIAHLGGSKPTIASAVGTLVHAASEEFPGGGDEQIAAFIDQRWSELHFDNPVDAARERRRVHTLLRKLGVYLDTVGELGGVVIGNEAGFELDVADTDADTDQPVAIMRGRVDRIEHYPVASPQSLKDAVGTALIVDIKTGGKSYASEVKDDKQLLAYQFAYRSGALEINGQRLSPNTLPPLSGARQVSLGAANTTKDEPYYRLPTQPALSDADAEAFRESVVAAARAMASDRFTFDADEHCHSQNEFSFSVCELHTVKAVSAS